MDSQRGTDSMSQRYMNSATRRLFAMGMALALALLLALGGQALFGQKAMADDKADKPNVTVTTSFLQDIVKILAGDYVNIDLIIPAGEDPHVYVPKPSDIKKLESADLVLYHGLHFEGKMVEALEATGACVTRDFDKKDLLTMDEDGTTITDPHFWFDLDLYEKAVEAASEDLVKLLPDHKKDIEEATKTYKKQLDELDDEIEKAMEKIPAESRVLVTPHDAFGYFSRCYDIEVMAPQGVTTDSEVANKAMGETAAVIAEKKVKAVFAESTTDPARMQKLQELVKAAGWDVKVVSGEGNELYSDSLAPEGEEGDTFIDMYRHNVQLISENLA